MELSVGLFLAAAEFVGPCVIRGSQRCALAFQDGYIIGTDKAAMLYAPVDGMAVDEPFAIGARDLKYIRKHCDELAPSDRLSINLVGPFYEVTNRGRMILRVTPEERLLGPRWLAGASRPKNDKPVDPNQLYDLLLLEQIAVASGYFNAPPVWLNFCDQTQSVQAQWRGFDGELVTCKVMGLCRHFQPQEHLTPLRDE